MKSAYELAMERLDAESGPSKKLSDEDRARIAEIDSKYDAQIAELKLGHDSKIASVSFAEIDGIKEELTRALAQIEERRERDKNAVWEDADAD